MVNIIIFVILILVIKGEYGLCVRYYQYDGIYFYYDKQHYHRLSKETYKQTYEIKILTFKKHGSDNPY